MTDQKNSEISDGYRLLMLALYGAVIVGVFTGFATNVIALAVTFALMMIGPEGVRAWAKRLTWTNAGIVGLGVVPVIMLLRAFFVAGTTPLDQIGIGSFLVGAAITFAAIVGALILKILVVLDATRFFDTTS